MENEAGSSLNLILGLAFLCLIIAAYWRIYTKAGQPGWAAIVPFYNLFVLFKIVGRPAWWLILLFIPVVQIIIYLVISLDLARSFGKGIGFGLGLFFLGFIFGPILGFGGARYEGPAASST